MSATLHLLCAGAARGLVRALADRIEASTGARLDPTFGAVGAMRDLLRAGTQCDVLVVTAAMTRDLVASGELQAGSARPIGRVPTALAAVVGAPRRAVDDADALRAALLGASSFCFPDATLSTAGAHVAAMLERLGLAAEMASRCRMFANGQTAMRELAAAADVQALGCTQATEIIDTPGVVLLGALPPPFALATVYAAALPAAAAPSPAAAALIELLAGEETRELRASIGFDEAGSLVS